MTEANPSLVRAGRRLLRRIAVVIFALVVLTGGVLALYVSRPESGLGREVLDLVDYPVRENEDLRYSVHSALGKMFSLCPCTDGLSADQYRRAWFHRPGHHEEEPAP